MRSNLLKLLSSIWSQLTTPVLQKVKVTMTFLFFWMRTREKAVAKTKRTQKNRRNRRSTQPLHRLDRMVCCIQVLLPFQVFGQAFRPSPKMKALPLERYKTSAQATSFLHMNRQNHQVHRLANV